MNKIYNDLFLMPVVLNLFDAYTNTTLDPGLSDEMKVYYSMRLINLAEPELIHDQFGQKHPIPKNSGKTIEFRKYDSLPKALVPLTEGVTPAGQKMSMGVIRATIKQYGGYIELSDILELTAIDNNLVQATRLLASQAGRTADTITREVLAGGTNVVYAGGAKDRSELVGGDSTAENNKYLTVDDIRKAVRALKVMNAQKINGYFAGIIHPDTAYDLMNDKKWVDVKTYSDPDGIYEGEIGKIEGVRFVETTEAKIFHAAPLKIEDGGEASAQPDSEERGQQGHYHHRKALRQSGQGADRQRHSGGRRAAGGGVRCCRCCRCCHHHREDRACHYACRQHRDLSRRGRRKWPRCVLYPDPRRRRLRRDGAGGRRLAAHRQAAGFLRYG